MTTKGLLILDFGSQYTNLIKTALAKLGFKTDIVAGDIKFQDWVSSNGKGNLAGLIFSGGAASVYDSRIQFDKKWLEVNVPILGICYGHQLIASQQGKVEKSAPEFGQSTLKILEPDILFNNVPDESTVWMSHCDGVSKLPDDYKVLASSDYSSIAAFKDRNRPIYGVQFHPEVSHTQFGNQILDNFCGKICSIEKGSPWTAKNFIETSIKELREKVGKEKIIFGLSGGVDSLTMSALFRKTFPKDQLLAVYVDSGLMPDETMREVKDFCSTQDIPLKTIGSANEFFEALDGIIDPTPKGKAIGKKFIDIFERVAKTSGAKIFAQGTIWSDVVESGVTKFSSQIKPHHNVGGLPKKLNFQLIEPLRELFKDQVREVAKELELPDWVIKRKVFPGPGFAIRVQGIVTPEKVTLVRKATKVIEEIIYSSPVKDDIWMAFAILIDVPSLGVRGDERTENEHAMVIRIVESKNSMTAQFSRKALPYLEEMSRRITNELEIGRVVYDITDKPPATIEWQ